MRSTNIVYQSECTTRTVRPSIEDELKTSEWRAGRQLWMRLSVFALNILIWTGCHCPDWQEHLRNLPLMPVVNTQSPTHPADEGHRLGPSKAV